MSAEHLDPLPPCLRLGQLLEAWELEAIAAHQAKLTGIPRGPITGLAKVDAEMGGAFAPGLHIIHGSPGAGKTAFALQVAGTNAAPGSPEAQCVAVFVSCEMATLELFRRVTARTTNTYLGRLKSGELVPTQSVALARTAAGHCPNLVLMDATAAAAPWEQIRTAGEIARGEAPRLLVVVDSLHSWAEAWAGVGESEMEYLPRACSNLRRLAQTLQCPVLAVAERNRASMKSSSQSAGAGSRKIEYGAESVIALQTKEEDQEDHNGETPVDLIFSKNRNGSKGKSVKLRFSGRLQKFTEAP